MTLIQAALIATAGFCLVFAGVLAIARRLNNYGVVDIAWSYAFGLLALGYALTLDGWMIRRALLAAVVTIWSLRLGTHLLRRVASRHPREDERYGKLREEWAAHFTAKMAAFFQMQALSVVVLGIPFLVSAANPAPRLHPFEIAAVGVWLLAFLGEALADRQLAAFKRGQADSPRVCDVGLWRYSRHPNYFFEWMIWVAYALFALASPWGWLGLLSPACILWLLLRVTGIPMTEEQSIRSKGEAYRRYQQSTRAFLPWFPRRTEKA